MELVRFLKGYCQSPKMVGAPAPSSRALAEVITEAARVRHVSSIVEFGPGTGVFTEMIAKKKRPEAKFFAIEIQEDFVRAVQERCPGVHVFHDSAVNARRYVKDAGLDGCDAIVSGLPFAIFEDDLQDDLLDAAHDVLKTGGVFATFSYFLSPLTPAGFKLRRKLRRRFSRVTKTHIVWRNFLPAFAYVCTK